MAVNMAEFKDVKEVKLVVQWLAYRVHTKWYSLLLAQDNDDPKRMAREVMNFSIDFTFSSNTNSQSQLKT